LGTARKGNGTYDKELVEVAKKAIKIGFRHIDGAEST
jgi:diketogulonate reductase-like aldo/keto reductase